MSEEQNKNKSKIKSLLKDIHSGQDKKIQSALKALKVVGDDSVITPILDVWNLGVSSQTEREIIDFICDIRSSSSTQSIMDAVLDDNYLNIQNKLLESIWNSKVDYSDYLVDFIGLATQKDFMVALECLTIIDNLKGPFEEHHLLDAEIILREYAEKEQKQPDKDRKKVQLIQEINTIVKRMMDN